MIGWPKIAYGSVLDCFRTLQKLQANKFWYNLDCGTEDYVGGSEEDKFQWLFSQLYIFCEQTCGSYCFWHKPSMLGDGQSVDFFKLYLLVKEKGGHGTVFVEELWDLVAKEIGLGSDWKLVYDKYLDRLDIWLQRLVKDKDSKGGLQDIGVDLSDCSMELEPEFRGSSSENLDQKIENGGYLYLDLEESDMDSTVGKLGNGNEVQGLVESDESRKSVEGAKNLYEGEDSVISGSSVVSNRKRKRKCKWRMLDWVANVAKNPCDAEVGSLPKRPNWRHHGSEHLWKQVLLAREAMFLKRNENSSAEQSISNWLKQRMHPSMYDDHSGSERQRSSQRLVSVKESRSLCSKIRPGSDSSSSTQTDLGDHFDRASETTSVFAFLDDQNRKRIPVGPFFQANVPEWTGETCESDSRWLGSQVWPLESGGPRRYLIERDRIGKGRQDSCGCENPGSIECVRFHVAEKRVRVKLELGLSFQRSKFDRMGEEVALSWTKEDEKRFEEIIKSNPASLDKCFWNEIVKSFPSKKREELVSYYFNVFLLRRRGCQNRSTPSNIDSDDEESEFGPVTSRYRHDALKTPGSIFCSPKKPHLNGK